MKNTIVLTALLTIVTLGSLPALGESLEPLTVSPGAIDRLTGVEVRCPTFSWQAVPGAVGYEVVVYELPPEVDLAAWSLDDAVEVLFVELPSGVTAWTPSLEVGLGRGADHVWFVRGVFEDGEGNETPWSRARFFRVVGNVSPPGIGNLSGEAREASGTGTGTGTGTGGAISRGTKATHGRSAMAKRVGEKRTKDVGTAFAAIRGEMADATGETYGVVGTSNSPDGAGLGAVNTAGGPDLVLDGVQDTETDLDVYQWGIDRASAGVESFGFANSISGSLDVWVQGNVDAYALFGDGAGVTNVDAETLDGIDSTNFSPLAHLHDGRYYTETELNTSGGGGSVHWDNLGNAPAGFADGVDNDTTYTAGTGLELAGTEFGIKGSGYGRVVVVATSGGDFTSIQSAIDSISGASPSVQYLVWVAPGQYIGRVTLKPYVHLQGAGQGTTEIANSAASTSWPPDQPTVTLASNSSVRDLTIRMSGGATWNTALLASTGMVDATVSDVTAVADGAGTLNYATVLYGAGTEVTLENVTSMSYGAATNNYGIYVWQGADITLRGGSYTGQGGTDATGIYNSAADTSLTAEGAFVVGENGTGDNRGLHNSNGALAVLLGGFYTGTGGTNALGIVNDGSGTTLETTSVRVVAEGPSAAIGLHNTGGASSVLINGQFSGAASGAGSATGIGNESGSLLDANDVIADGESTSGTGSGLVVSGGAIAVLRGGGYTASGVPARGINVRDAGTEVTATGVAAASNGGGNISGLRAVLGSRVVLAGGSFVSQGGDPSASGIAVGGSSTTLEATDVAALGELSIGSNFGMNMSAGTVELYGGSFIGRGGDFARGIRNYLDGTLDASGITAIAEDASSNNHGLNLVGSFTRVGASQVFPGVYRSGGTLTCYHVYNGNFIGYSCP